MGSHSDLSIEELVRQCSTGGNLAVWEEFVRRFHRLIAKVVVHTAAKFGDCSQTTADDLIQETYLRICGKDFRLLREFDQRHPGAFLGLLKIVTVSVVRDHFKSTQTLKRGARQIIETSDPSNLKIEQRGGGGSSSMERAVLIREIEEHLDSCVSGPDRERKVRIFWLYYRVGLSAAAIAALPGIGITTKGVESLILRITRDLRVRLAVSNYRDTKTAPSEGILPSESF